MKTISLWQPWASAIAVGLKHIETRGWSTNYRGPLAIHAAKRWTRAEREFLGEARCVWGNLQIPAAPPLGCIVAICTLADVRSTDELYRSLCLNEIRYGNYGPGRFGWRLDNIMALRVPVPWKGAQGFFNVPDDLLRGAA